MSEKSTQNLGDISVQYELLDSNRLKVRFSKKKIKDLRFIEP
jgi:hypothetical protein